MSTGTEERSYRIGEVAALVGTTTRTIRFWEELGLLGAQTQRSKGAHRTYDEGDVARLRELIRLRDLLGLSLEELTTLAEAEEARAELRQRWHSDPSDAERLRILEASIPLVERQLELASARQRTLAEFRAELEAKLERLREHRAKLSERRPG